jgi:hypothetical protein
MGLQHTNGTKPQANPRLSTQEPKTAQPPEEEMQAAPTEDSSRHHCSLKLLTVHRSRKTRQRPAQETRPLLGEPQPRNTADSTSPSSLAKPETETASTPKHQHQQKLPKPVQPDQPPRQKRGFQHHS